MPSEFKAVLLEGVFVKAPDGSWKVRQAGNPEQDVQQVLGDLEGQMVQLSAHHLPVPPTPNDPSKWINVAGAGHLKLTEDTLEVVSFDGSKHVVDLAEFEGCYARIVAASLQTVEQMRDLVEKSGMADQIEGLGKRAEELRNLMKSISPEKGDS